MRTSRRRRRSGTRWRDFGEEGRWSSRETVGCGTVILVLGRIGGGVTPGFERAIDDSAVRVVVG